MIWSNTHLIQVPKEENIQNIEEKILKEEIRIFQKS
jgi:hypothetical protein